MAGIMLTVTSVGLRSRRADPLLLLRNPRLGVRAMVSMFVLMPLFVIGLTWVLPVVDQAAHAALIALAVSPMPPILPRRQVKVGAGGDYTVGLQVLASLFSIIIAPIFIWLAGQLEGVATVFDPAEALRVLAVTIGAPLAAGILIARLWPRAAALSTPLARVSLLLLVAGGAVSLVAEASGIASQICHGVLLCLALATQFATHYRRHLHTRSKETAATAPSLPYALFLHNGASLLKGANRAFPPRADGQREAVKGIMAIDESRRCARRQSVPHG